MQNRSFLFFLLMLILPAFSFADNQNNFSDTVITRGKIDTSTKIENKVIDEVIESKNVKKDKAQYLSEVTKYGFKNLFKNYTYNSSIPYTSQVNPYAENYMQDYLKAHQNYLLNLRKTATPYFNLIDGILTQYGLP
ncbi:MAG: hypothetical protein ACTHOB_00005, partial [Ginsengibacter sp.]